MLQEPVSSLKGIGPKKAEALKKLDIRTVEDFLFFYPRDYEVVQESEIFKDFL